MTYKALLFAILAVFASSGVFAQSFMQENEDDKAKSFEQLDANGDGSLEESEVLKAQDDADFEGVEFDTLDEDEDGEVSQDEWNNYFRNKS